MSDESGDGEELKGYYVIKFERFIDLMNEIEHKYQIIANLIDNKVKDTTPESWDDTEIPTLMELFTNVNDTRSLLEDKINNPLEEEIKLANKYNIKDVLIKESELSRMNTLLLAGEEIESGLEIDYKISIVAH